MSESKASSNEGTSTLTIKVKLKIMKRRADPTILETEATAKETVEVPIEAI